MILSFDLPWQTNLTIWLNYSESVKKPYYRRRASASTVSYHQHVRSCDLPWQILDESYYQHCWGFSSLSWQIEVDEQLQYVSLLRFAVANFGSELPPAREALRFALANFGSELSPAREVLRFAVANFESELPPARESLQFVVANSGVEL